MKKTVYYSIIHMLVDGLCAYTLAWTSPDIRYALRLYLIYNFCAFVLQMPIGAVIDRYMQRNRIPGLPLTYALIGSAMTLAGSVSVIFIPASSIPQLLGVIILGCGNALFHVGGGVGSIFEDHENNKKGQNLGLFVAPGALGLFLGARYDSMSPLISIGFYLIVSVIVYCMLSKTYTKETTDTYWQTDNDKDVSFSKNDLRLIICCFVVVILRSYIGLGVSMSWKIGMLLPLIAVLCVVLGKISGGILAARFDMGKVILVTLVMASICYAVVDYPLFGLIALLTFNTTMPITLYMLVNRFRDFPGFFFGLLTVALFTGYIPVYFKVTLPFSSNIIGVAGCTLSLLILLYAYNIYINQDKQ